MEAPCPTSDESFVSPAARESGAFASTPSSFFWSLSCEDRELPASPRKQAIGDLVVGFTDPWEGSLYSGAGRPDSAARAGSGLKRTGPKRGGARDGQKEMGHIREQLAALGYRSHSITRSWNTQNWPSPASGQGQLKRFSARSTPRVAYPPRKLCTRASLVLCA